MFLILYKILIDFDAKTTIAFYRRIDYNSFSRLIEPIYCISIGRRVSMLAFKRCGADITKGEDDVAKYIIKRVLLAVVTVFIICNIRKLLCYII